MADDLDISHGGAIAVDTEHLRALIPSFTDAAERFARARWHLYTAYEESSAYLGAGQRVWQAGGLAENMRKREQETRELATHTLDMARAYEFVEREARIQADFGRDDLEGWVDAMGDLAAAHLAHPAAARIAREATRQWKKDRVAGFVDQVPVPAFNFALFPSMALTRSALEILQGLTMGLRLGVIKPGSTLRGTPTPMRTHTESVAPARAVRSVHDALGRIPSGKPQIRVEKYEFPDGTTEFLVYIIGTRALVGREVFDMISNLKMYGGEVSESYEGVRQALKDAGAGPGDTVHAIGHSQGAMVASRMAIEGEFEVKTLITAGSPVEAPVSEETLSIQLRHTDDFVPLLAGGGTPMGVGSPDSIVVERIGDPERGLHDLALKTHHLDTYRETARMLDESTDPRVDALRARFDHLGTANAVTATEFSVSPASEEPSS